MQPVRSSSELSLHVTLVETLHTTPPPEILSSSQWYSAETRAVLPSDARAFSSGLAIRGVSIRPTAIDMAGVPTHARAATNE